MPLPLSNHKETTLAIIAIFIVVSKGIHTILL
jgi:hypothetical protein